MNHKKSRKKRRAMRAYRTLLFSSENAKLAGRRTWRYKRSDPTAEAGLLGRRLNCCRRQNCDEDEPFDFITMAKPLSLSLAQARAISLRSQGLADDSAPFGFGKEGVLAAIRHLGYV